MSGARLYSEKTADEVRAAIKRGESTRSIAARLGMSPSTVSNISRNRIYRPEEEVRAEQRVRCAAMRAARGQWQRVDPDIVEDAVRAVRHPTGVVAQAIAERSSGKPLVVETLEARLAAAIPTARYEYAEHCDADAHQVWRGSSVLATAASKREAVDKAIALWGGR